VWTGVLSNGTNSVHRVTNATETNTKDDWVVGPQSWGN
jgi:hypothetical protein